MERDNKIKLFEVENKGKKLDVDKINAEINKINAENNGKKLDLDIINAKNNGKN